MADEIRGAGERPAEWCLWHRRWPCWRVGFVPYPAASSFSLCECLRRRISNGETLLTAARAAATWAAPQLVCSAVIPIRWGAQDGRKGQCAQAIGSQLPSPRLALLPVWQSEQVGKAAAACWRQRYRERLEVERNWRAGRCTWSRLQGHNDYIRCCQQQGGSLASCSGSYLHRDCSIRQACLSSRGPKAAAPHPQEPAGVPVTRPRSSRQAAPLPTSPPLAGCGTLRAARAAST
jgi:hypothetical protein